MMAEYDWRPEQARKSLNRILPEVEKTFAAELEQASHEWHKFKNRLHREWERLFVYLHQLYGWQYDFFYTLERILNTLVQYWLQRPAELKLLDEKREADPLWFLSENVVGGVLYVDLFSDNLSKLDEHISYFKKLGINYLHLMPLFAVPKGDNDGGYAVSDYRAINPDIGTMDELRRLAAELRNEGISLVLDFVFNHTSDEHIWAQKAKSKDPDFLAYYLTFPNRELPDQFQKYLREIFPSVRKGSFTWCEEMKRWVWTTFNSFQWDLNYSNPEVFRAMAEDMLFLANQGVEVLRLDAVAFIWKRLGTNCENQPEAHTIIRAFNAMAKIVAPCLLFKSEAIVHPDEVIRYIHPDECQLSYNPLLMALLWEALATREVKLLEYSMRNRYPTPSGSTWVNFVRCHDDIGWTFDDQDARNIGIDPVAHRRFLNQFYTGEYPGSFAKGVFFQFNADTGDVRVSGTLSSLAGLEDALEKQDGELIEQAVRRINLLRSILVSIGGIPLLYIGDEWGVLNDYTYLSDPGKADDSRWVHRSRKRWNAREDLTDQDTLEWRFFHEMVKLFSLRKTLPALQNGGMEVIHTGNSHLFGYIRAFGGQKILVVNNFAEEPQKMDAHHLNACGATKDAIDLLNNEVLSSGKDLVLNGYQSVWLNIS
ncbi:MAG: alpha-glucosidase C-terminal domain-containing protein [Desulfobacterales bacterium]|jgi:amylosucrase|nr:alpha-glucosidase C-terminal domain-containing protein [Desulfobacterales bacterium]